MSKRIFTKEQIKKLSKNKGIVKCSSKSITFSKDFKIKSIKLYEEQGLSPQEIFKKARLDLNLIERKMPKECLRRWRKIYRAKGIAGLSEARGNNNKNKGRPRTKHLNDSDKIKYLETQVAYLKAENDFLAKLRAKRAE